MLSDEQLIGAFMGANGGPTGLRAVEAAVRADQIEKDTALIEEAGREAVCCDGPGCGTVRDWVSAIAAAIRAQLGTPND